MILWVSQRKHIFIYSFLFKYKVKIDEVKCHLSPSTYEVAMKCNPTHTHTHTHAQTLYIENCENSGQLLNFLCVCICQVIQSSKEEKEGLCHGWQSTQGTQSSVSYNNNLVKKKFVYPLCVGMHIMSYLVPSTRNPN